MMVRIRDEPYRRLSLRPYCRLVAFLEIARAFSPHHRVSSSCGYGIGSITSPRMLSSAVVDEDTIDAVRPAIDVDSLVIENEDDEQESITTGKPAIDLAYRSGFIAVVGSPNVGKSSLVNALVGERLCITTSKSQTTRHGILGVVTTDNYQLALTDTPGLLAKPAYELHRGMMTAAKRACKDADCILFVTDIFESVDVAAAAGQWVDAETRRNLPVIVAVNKVDLMGSPTLSEETAAAVGSVEKALCRAAQAVPNAAAVCPVSALDGSGLDELTRAIVHVLPEADPVFPDLDTLTNRPARFFASEIIREHILKLYSKEVPYSCEVAITRFKEDNPNCVEIDATIIVDRTSQKAILIGHKGGKIKQLGIHSRKAMEDFFQVPKINLKLWVKVDQNWRTDQTKLRSYGYPV